MFIRTQRMELVAAGKKLSHMAATDREGLAQILGAKIPDSWPPEVMRDIWPLFAEKMDSDPSHVGWWAWHMILLEPERTVIGGLGLGGKPVEGRINMGYAVLPEYEGKGYATEAARALVDWAFQHAEVDVIAADTLEDHKASRRIMEKLGMVFVGPGPEEGTVLYELHRSNLR